jgi:hypothetical protein
MDYVRDLEPRILNLPNALDLVVQVVAFEFTGSADVRKDAVALPFPDVNVSPLRGSIRR